MAASDMVFASDKAQSNPETRVNCPKDKRHGGLLMSIKTGFLECGTCGYSVVAPTSVRQG